uniref:hypothetical protein n=1 Tax=uncultured Rikenella sp. TaxID=368003 RepID=UPI0026035D4E
ANKAKTTLTKRPMGAPAGQSDTAYRLISSAKFLVRAGEILFKRASRVRMISYFSNRARSSFVTPKTALRGRRTVNKAKTTLTKRPMGAPAGRSDTAYRLSSLAQFLVRAGEILSKRASTF